MKVLLIEDDDKKSEQIQEFFKGFIPEPEIIHRKSYQSGLKEIFTNSFDVVLLDMQLPTFDIKFGDDGYKFRNLAGHDILRELKRKKKFCKVIIITQFETFGEGENYIELNDLKSKLKSEFDGYYLGTVYYNPSQYKWVNDLRTLINNVLNDGENTYSRG